MMSKTTYEKKDVNFAALARALALFMILLLFVFAASSWVLRMFARKPTTLEITRLMAQARRLPPEPRLQADPAEDLAQLRRDEDALLNRYAWIDKEKGIVRIPIERAIDVLLDQGVPARTANQESGS